jgi:hypothetical protein
MAMNGVKADSVRFVSRRVLNCFSMAEMPGAHCIRSHLREALVKKASGDLFIQKPLPYNLLYAAPKLGTNCSSALSGLR